MKRNKILPISKDALETFSTKRLLARLKSLHQREQSFELSDRDKSERNINGEYIEFKESIEWQTEHQKLKEVLKTREHISKRKR